MTATATAPATQARKCYFLDETMSTDGRNWKVGVVEENEPGYFPDVTFVRDSTFAEADAIVNSWNERMGISRADRIEIVSSSMAAQNRR